MAGLVGDSLLRKLWLDVSDNGVDGAVETTGGFTMT